MNCDDVSWGPNSKFRFPLYGGTGQICKNMIPLFEGKLFLNKKAVSIDPSERKIIFQDNSEVSYDYL